MHLKKKLTSNKLIIIFTLVHTHTHTLTEILFFGILILQSFDIICGLPNEYKLQSTNAPCSTSTCQQTGN